MSSGIFLLLVINFLYVSLLPVVFFKRDGKLNRMWWLTAWPFIACPAVVLLSLLGYLPPLTGYGTNITESLGLVAVALHVASISLICFTLGTHRIPISLWHQANDSPQHIVTWGAYSKIRHPFYASFLLAFVGALLYCPQVGTLAMLLYSTIILNLTASREEERLSKSEFGKEYQDYVTRTGRFFPKLGVK